MKKILGLCVIASILALGLALSPVGAKTVGYLYGDAAVISGIITGTAITVTGAVTGASAAITGAITGASTTLTGTSGVTISTSATSSISARYMGAYATLPTSGVNEGAMAYQVSDHALYVATHTVASAADWKIVW